MSKPLRLLGIFAHPDDESFGSGGVLAKYAAEGVDVHVCIATDGAAGSADAEMLEGYNSLAERRAEELKAAVAVLGGVLHQLSYGDSGMEGSAENQNPDCLVQAPLDDVAKKLPNFEVNLVDGARDYPLALHHRWLYDCLHLYLYGDHRA